MTVNDVCEIEDGKIRAVDFSKLYRFSISSPIEVALTTRRNEAVAPRILLQTNALSLTNLNGRNAQLLSKPFTKVREPFESLRKTTAETFHVASDDGSLRIQLPFGMPQFVNARTLKALFGASRADVLFRKMGERWEICPDSYRVDLADRDQIFRLGRIQIYS